MAVIVSGCPFCGYDDVQIDEVDISQFAVTCPDCMATGPLRNDVMLSIADWNAAHQGQAHHA